MKTIFHSQHMGKATPPQEKFPLSSAREGCLRDVLTEEVLDPQSAALWVPQPSTLVGDIVVQCQEEQDKGGSSVKACEDSKTPRKILMKPVCCSRLGPPRGSSGLSTKTQAAGHACEGLS